MNCIFTSDLHGKFNRYEKLFSIIEQEVPQCVFLGGDLIPHAYSTQSQVDNFIVNFMVNGFRALKNMLGPLYPVVFLIPGNDDPRISEDDFIKTELSTGLWKYMHMRKTFYLGFQIFGYAIVPPTPFMLKDWEKYDVSRYVDPGCTHPTEGFRTKEPAENPLYTTIEKDLILLTGNDDLSNAIFLFHTPPYNTSLDRAALDGKRIDHVPLDVHVGSIAVKRFIEERCPLVTMHGHIHESTTLTGAWKEKINKTWSYNGSTEKPELCLIRFNTDTPGEASRELV